MLIGDKSCAYVYLKFSFAPIQPFFVSSWGTEVRLLDYKVPSHYSGLYELYWEICPSCWVGLLRFAMESRQEHSWVGGWRTVSLPPDRGSSLAWVASIHVLESSYVFQCACALRYMSVIGEGAGRGCVQRARDQLRASGFHVLFYGICHLYHPEHRTKSHSGF